MFLTIAIPTYNRPEQLCRRLSELLVQIKGREDVEIVVIDNASRDSVERVIAEYFGESVPSLIRVRTNIANIGMAANICRCFEHSRGKWTWLLGDDDRVHPDALDVILHTLENPVEDRAPADVFCFSSGIHSYSSSFEVETPEELWKSLDSAGKFSNFLFISNKIVRTESFLRFAGVGYQFCYSAAPHMAVFMAILSSGKIIRFETGYVIDWVQPAASESWNGYLVVAGIPSLIEVIGNEVSVLKHLDAGLDLTLWKPYLRGGIHLILFEETRPPEYWYYQLRKFVIFLKGKRLLYTYVLLFFCKMAILFPGSKKLMRYFLSRVKVDMKSPTSGMDRN